MKREYVDDTVLLPVLQYLLKLFQTRSQKEAFLEVRAYKELFYNNRVFETRFEEKATENRTAMDELFKCIESYEKNPEDGTRLFSSLYDIDLRCGLCKDCNDCVRAFALKIYKALSGKEIPDLFCAKDFEYERLPVSVEKHLRTDATKIGKYYDELRLQHTRTKLFKNSLVVLKGTSSSTPSVLNAAFDTQEYHGGGFFISWDGFGIVVDPGYHFLTNLHDAGLDVNDIDAVVITHEHIDHNIDMRLLDDLLYNQRRFGDGAKKIRWYVDAATYKMMEVLRSYDSGFKEKSCDIFKMTPAPGNEEFDTGKYLNWGENSSIRMKVFKTTHCYKEVETEDKKKKKEFFDHSFGIELFLSEGKQPDKKTERKIFYSSDAKYTPELTEYVINSDIVIANISSVYKTDILRMEEKDSHLGYLGCYELLKATRGNAPRFFLVSEFWNGITDIRFDICKYLKEQIERNEGIKDCRILPAEIGMEIDIKNLRIKCDSCGRFVDEFITVRQHVNNGKISIFCSACIY